MVSTYHGIETGRRAITYFRKTMEIAGVNTTKANNEGYSRQVVNSATSSALSATPTSSSHLGTGVEETWLALAEAVFAALDKPVDIRFVDMPESIRDQYQYRTKADITRFRSAGYTGEFRRVKDGVRDYIVNHLLRDNPYINNGNG